MMKKRQLIAASRVSTLYRTPQSGTNCHFYTVSIDVTLFDEITVTRSWGPLNGTARSCQWIFKDFKEAGTEFRRLVRIARRRGYGSRIPKFNTRVHTRSAPALDERQLALL